MKPRKGIDNEVEAALASWFGDEWPAMGALARSGLVDDMRAALTAAAKVRAPSYVDVVGIPGMKAISALIDEQGHAKNCLVIHFDHEVTDADRRNIVAAHNAAKVRANSEGDGEFPARIWAGDFDDQGFGHAVAGMQGGLYEEYVRADLLPATGGEKV